MYKLKSTPSDSTTPSKPIFRLTDHSRFECAIEALAKHWERGSISVIHDDSGVTVMDVHLGSSNSTEPTARHQEAETRALTSSVA